MLDDSRDITRILVAHREGVEGAVDRLVSLVYDDLRRIARHQLRIRSGQSLDTTALVHELYLRLVDQSRVSWADRQHFFAVAARAMRQILVDHARSRCRQKRGGGAPFVELDEERVGVQHSAEAILAIHQALDKLAEHDPRLEQVVELRFFAGLSEAETAEALSLSTRTVRRDWSRAIAWLRVMMEPAT